MAEDYFTSLVTVGVFAAGVVGLVVMTMGLNRLVRPKVDRPEKFVTYECGVDPIGGGWSQTGPEPASFGIGLLIQVPWDQANTRHTFTVELLDADGVPVEFEGEDVEEQAVAFGGDFEVGRPPGLKPGTPLDFPVAVNSTPLPLEPGRYEWRLTIDGESRQDRTLPFTVRGDGE